MSKPPESLIGIPDIQIMLTIARVAPPGAIVEVGVYKGGSAWYLNQVCREQRRALHLFDTFTGIPNRTEGVDVHKVGDFRDTALDKVRAAIPDAIFHVGVFPKTMPNHFPSVAFVHVDCDQYKCVIDCFDVFWDLLPRGGIIYLDDYQLLPGVARAVNEFCIENSLTPEKPTQRQCYVVKP